ncbi:MAG: hypothetical protein ABIF88_00735 [archaeon]
METIIRNYDCRECFGQDNFEGFCFGVDIGDWHYIVTERGLRFGLIDLVSIRVPDYAFKLEDYFQTQMSAYVRRISDSLLLGEIIQMFRFDEYERILGYIAEGWIS